MLSTPNLRSGAIIGKTTVHQKELVIVTDSGTSVIINLIFKANLKFQSKIPDFQEQFQIPENSVSPRKSQKILGLPNHINRVVAGSGRF